MRQLSFYIESLGCIANRVDTSRVEKFLTANDWVQVVDLNEADLIILMTCAVTKVTEDHNLQRLVELKNKKRDDAQIVVGGCLPSINRERLSKFFTGFVFSPRTLHRLDSEFGSKTSIDDIQPSMDDFAESPIRTIRISTGCMSRCSYCAIPFANGKTLSRPIDGILHDIDIAVAEGMPSLKLVSEDVGAYGQDRHTTIVDLLKAIKNHRGNFNIYLDTLNANWFYAFLPELLETMKDERFVKSFCVPLQSGSNRILQLMKRGYTIEQGQAVLDAILNVFPAAKISTDFIVGFPTETVWDLRASLRIIQKYSFHHTQIFTYEERPRTSARDLVPKIGEDEKEKRRQLLFKATMQNFLCSNGITDVRKLDEVLSNYTRLPVNFNLILQ